MGIFIKLLKYSLLHGEFISAMINLLF